MNRIRRKWHKWFAIPLAVVLVAGTVMGVQMTRQPTTVLASGVTAANIALTGQDTVNDFTFVQFDVAWDYSWRDAENWDAAWIFVKYKESGGVWEHATLATSGHTAPSGSTIDATADGKGVFIYRSSSGAGNIDWDGVKLKWLYGTGGDGLADDAIIKMKVFAIEMVYIPEGSFVLSGESDNLLANFNSGNTISSEDALAEGAITWEVTESINSGAQESDGSPGGSDTLGASYPKGFQGFYVMKYEISQRQYAEFLNTLTETQQKALTGGNADAEARDSIPAVGYWAMSGADNEASPLYRSYIKTGSYTAGSPATFICDANDNDTGNESNDGGWTAANYISWADGLAYADWAGLRPMTELEFEKACRGSGTAGDEYAWGTTSIVQATGIGSANTENEVSSNAANCVYGDHASVPGPLRVGALTDADDSREEAGASYYGVMGMSGNLWERCVTVANYCWDGSVWTNATGAGAFDGQHGDGSLTAAGYADVASWPSPMATGAVYTAYGAGIRGGSWNSNFYVDHLLRVSDRNYAARPNANRDRNSGFRLVRTP